MAIIVFSFESFNELQTIQYPFVCVFFIVFLFWLDFATRYYKGKETWQKYIKTL